MIRIAVLGNLGLSEETNVDLTVIPIDLEDFLETAFELPLVILNGCLKHAGRQESLLLSGKGT